MPLVTPRLPGPAQPQVTSRLSWYKQSKTALPACLPQLPGPCAELQLPNPDFPPCVHKANAITAGAQPGQSGSGHRTTLLCVHVYTHSGRGKTPALPLTSRVTLGKSHHLSEPPLPHLQKAETHNCYPTGLSEIWHIKSSVQCLGQVKKRLLGLPWWRSS